MYVWEVRDIEKILDDARRAGVDDLGWAAQDLTIAGIIFLRERWHILIPVAK